MIIQQRKRNTFKQYLLLAFKLCIAATAVFFIFRQVNEKEKLENTWSIMINVIHESSKLYLLIFIFLLMILNWCIEAIKWKRMISKLEQITFIESLKAVLAGLTISFFTPNRIGEYGGRVFYLEHASKLKATLVTIVECLSQLVITVFIGSFALLFWINSNHRFTGILFWIVAFMCLLTAFFSVFAYVNIDKAQFFFGKWKNKKRIAGFIQVLNFYSGKELASILLLALARYIIFSFQFYLFIFLFGLFLPPTEAAIAIALTFFTMTVIPTITLAELGVRGAVATFYFSEINVDTLPVLFASAALWIVNLVFPALIGVVFILFMKLDVKKNE